MSLAATFDRAFAKVVAVRAVAVPLLPALSDEDLARRISGGDRWAEEAFYRRHVDTVYGVVCPLLGRSHEAEDVVQETFATAFEIWNQLREPARARQWLLQIAVRKVHRRFRRRRVLRALGLDRSTDDATLEALARFDVDGETRAELAILDRVLRELAAAERIAWMLRHVEGLGLEEVAEECGCSLATVKRRVARAQARVEAHVRLEVKSDE